MASTAGIRSRSRPPTISAERVADAILRGIAKQRANIFTDTTTTVLDRLVRIAPGLTQRWLDHRVGTVTGRR